MDIINSYMLSLQLIVYIKNVLPTLITSALTAHAVWTRRTLYKQSLCKRNKLICLQ